MGAAGRSGGPRRRVGRRRRGEPRLSRLVREELARVEAEVALCRRCFGDLPRWPARLERPEGRGRILVLCEKPARAALESRARFGLDSPDATSRALRRRVADAGIAPEEVIVGAAVLCRPASPELEQAVPSSLCRRECTPHLYELVRAAQPRLLVPLGATALRALRDAFPRQQQLRRMRFPAAVGRTWEAGGTYIHPLYHVAPRTRAARPDAVQREDWAGLSRLWDWISSGETGKRPPGVRFVAGEVDTGPPDV